MPHVAVVVVNWNGKSLLDACLTSVADQRPAPERVIVVDNGSEDGSLDHLRARWPDVVAIDAGANLGFSGGNNLGIRDALAAGAELVLLLNNDAQLLPGALAELVAGLEASGQAAWAAVPKILYRARPEVIWSAGGRFDWWRGLSLDRGSNELDRGQYDRPELVDFANACCMLVRAETLRTIGLLDDAYFMYFEDSDLAARALARGVRVAYRPAARVLHDVQASSGGVGEGPSASALYFWTRNRARFIARNAPGVAYRLVAHAYAISSRMVRMAQAGLAGRSGEAGLIARAMLDGYVRRATGDTFPGRGLRAAGPARVARG